MIIIFLVALLVLFLASMTLFIRGTNRYSPIEFYSRAREVGFNFTEANQIKKMAGLAECEDPTNVFWSIRDFDAVIKMFSASFRKDGTEKKHENVLFMERLFEFRKKLEFDQPKYHIGIKSSRMIRLNQRLRILLQGTGVFNASVIENNERCLSITLPIGGKLPAAFTWKGSKLSVYFWRQDDAGYVFDTYVLEEVRVRGIPVLQLGHSDALFRTQKRKSLRIRSQTSAYLYLLKHLHGAYEKPERVPGMKCILQDVSEDGAAVLIGGKAKPGMMVKIQAWLDDDQIVISGTVKGADYDTGKNQSQLHIEAIPPSPRMRNLIRAHVYNTKDGAAGDDDAVFDESVFSTR